MMPSWKSLSHPLVIRSCLFYGQHAEITSTKVTKYLLGARETVNLFKLDQLRYLLLRIYPLIHNLFHSFRQNMMVNTKMVRFEVYPWKKKTHSIIYKRTAISPQILFATITPNLAKIISNAAQLCNMPWHENRWLNGSITAAISYPSDPLMWQFLQDSTQKKIDWEISKKWGSNKENKEKTKKKLEYQNRSRWPSLLVIPDISKNRMILKEADQVGLPVIGLINSDSHIEIDYPIFAQDQTWQSVYFFCHFLAALITKETVYTQHKRSTLQKTFSNGLKSPYGLEREQIHFWLKTRAQLTLEPKARFLLWRKFFYWNFVKPVVQRHSKKTIVASFVKKLSWRLGKTLFYLGLNGTPTFKEWVRWKLRLPHHVPLNLHSLLKKRLFFRRFKREWIISWWRLSRRLKKTKKIKPLRITLQKQKDKKKKKYWSSHFSKKCVPSSFFEEKRIRFTIQKYLFQRFYGFQVRLKHPSRTYKILRAKAFSQLQSVFLKNMKTIRGEYLKKYYLKNSYTLAERKKIYQKTQTFLWKSKIVRQLYLYRPFFRNRKFPQFQKYYWNDLQDWSQDLFLQKERVIWPLLVRLQNQRREGRAWVRAKYRWRRRLFKKSKYQVRISKPKPQNFYVPPKRTLTIWDRWILNEKPKFLAEQKILDEQKKLAQLNRNKETVSKIQK